MSNEVLNESFFSNASIPNCEKLGLVALLGQGTYEENAMSFDGKSQAFVSNVGALGGGKTTIMFTFGRGESLSNMAVKTYLHSMGLDRGGVDIDKIFDGSKTDKEVVNEVSEFYKTVVGIDKTKIGESYEKLVSPLIDKYFEKLRTTDNYLTQNPKILENLKNQCNEVYLGDKKKQMTE